MEPRQGLSHARNRGWLEANGDYVAYIDDDAKVSPNWCYLIRKSFLEIVPSPEIVGGSVYPWYEISPPSWFDDDWEVKRFTNNKGFISVHDAGVAVIGGNMVFKKDILVKHGGFSADYGMKGSSIGLGEETELFARIDDSTLVWYDPDIRINHFVPKSKMTFSYQLRRSFEKGRVKARLEKARKTSAAYWRIVFGTALFVAAKAPLRLILSRSGFKREWAGVIKEFGIRFGYISNAR